MWRKTGLTGVICVFILAYAAPVQAQGGDPVRPTPTVPAESVSIDPALATSDLGLLTIESAPPPGADPEVAQWVFDLGAISTGGPVVAEIYARGQALGNNPNAFSKIGDCNSEVPFFLAKFDRGEYDLGPYRYLQPVVDTFAGSFERQSMTVWTGNHAWAVLDATWSNPAYCQPGETPLACEFRLHRPSIVLIRLGTNEAGSTDLFEKNLRLIIEFAIDKGVIPILGTKADRIEGSDAHNQIVRRLAAEYGVPLWDFSLVAEKTIPGRGLLPDGFHMTYTAPYYTSPAALQTGHSLQNLTALIALHAVWQAVMVSG